MITGTNEWKTLTKHISCECKCRFDGICRSDNWWNNDKCWCKCKKRRACEKYYVWNPVTYNSKNEKYLGSIVGDSAQRLRVMKL